MADIDGGAGRSVGKKYLTRAALYVFIAFCAVGLTTIGAIVYLCALSGRGFALALVCALGFIGVAAAVIVYLVKPYRRIARLQRMFLDEAIYDEFFLADVFFSPEERLVMERFRYLLRKQDMIRLSQKQAEYLALQNQINPHFLYNTLEAIRGDALEAKAYRIAETTEALATFFRYTITEMSDLVTVSDELDSVENYFTIQQYRFGEKLSIRILAEDDAVYACRIPKLTLQPIIENAIFHGLETKPDDGRIDVLLQLTMRRAIIRVRDNGVGIPPDALARINEKLEKVRRSYIRNEQDARTGIALRNVAQRIKLLFGEEYGLQVYSTPGIGTEVVINLPRESEQEETNEAGTPAH